MEGSVASASTTTYALRTNTTVTAPSGITDGDLLLLFFFQGAAGGTPAVPTPPTGFTALTPSPIQMDDGSFFGDYRAFRKTASGESGDYTVTHDNASSQGIMLRIIDVDTGTAFQESGNTGTGTTTTFTGITTPAADYLVVAAAIDWADTSNNLTPPAGSTPTFTEHIDTVLSYAASGVFSSSGATGNKTMTNNASSINPWGAYLIGIAPTGGASPGSGSDASSIGISESSSNLVTVGVIEETS